MTQPFELDIGVLPETARCEPREAPRKVNDSKPAGLKAAFIHLHRPFDTRPGQRLAEVIMGGNGNLHFIAGGVFGPGLHAHFKRVRLEFGDLEGMRVIRIAQMEAREITSARPRRQGHIRRAGAAGAELDVVGKERFSPRVKTFQRAGQPGRNRQAAARPIPRQRLEMERFIRTVKFAVAENHHGPCGRGFTGPEARQIEAVKRNFVVRDFQGVEILSERGRHPLRVGRAFEMRQAAGVGKALSQHLVFIVEQSHGRAGGGQTGALRKDKGIQVPGGGFPGQAEIGQLDEGLCAQTRVGPLALAHSLGLDKNDPGLAPAQKLIPVQHDVGGDVRCSAPANS